MKRLLGGFAVCLVFHFSQCIGLWAAPNAEPEWYEATINEIDFRELNFEESLELLAKQLSRKNQEYEFLYEIIPTNYINIAEVSGMQFADTPVEEILFYLCERYGLRWRMVNKKFVFIRNTKHRINERVLLTEALGGINAYVKLRKIDVSGFHIDYAELVNSKSRGVYWEVCYLPDVGADYFAGTPYHLFKVFPDLFVEHQELRRPDSRAEIKKRD